jgi:hypothetical protein
MGSLNANGIPVVAKTSTTIINRDGRQVYRTVSTNDTDATIVSSPPDRVIGSGSVVRDDGSVQYIEEVAYGLYMGGRSNNDRVASKVGATRDQDVELGDNQTMAVIPTTLTPHTPQLDTRHTGNRVTTHQSVGDSLVERVANSGSF